MSIVRVGLAETKGYEAGWDAIFGSKTKAAKAAPKKKAATKKAKPATKTKTKTAAPKKKAPAKKK